MLIHVEPMVKTLQTRMLKFPYDRPSRFPVRADAATALPSCKGFRSPLIIVGCVNLVCFWLLALIQEAGQETIWRSCVERMP